jgi:hypothetical protein
MTRHRSAYDETDRLIVRTIVGSYPPNMRAEKDFPDRVAKVVAMYLDDRPPATLWETYRKASRTIKAGVLLFLSGVAAQVGISIGIIVSYFQR